MLRKYLRRKSPIIISTYPWQNWLKLCWISWRPWYLCRAVWRQDGLTSLEARIEGRYTTVPVTFTGHHLEINAWTRFAGEVRVEVAQLNGAKIPGLTFEECEPASGDAINQVTTWQGKSDLSAWAEQPLRLRFHLRRARLHAIQFV